MHSALLTHSFQQDRRMKEEDNGKDFWASRKKKVKCLFVFISVWIKRAREGSFSFDCVVKVAILHPLNDSLNALAVLKHSDASLSLLSINVIWNSKMKIIEKKLLESFLCPSTTSYFHSLQILNWNLPMNGIFNRDFFISRVNFDKIDISACRCL